MFEGHRSGPRNPTGRRAVAILAVLHSLADRLILWLFRECAYRAVRHGL